MRKKVILKTKDNHIIKGCLDTGKNDKLIVFVHGFTGSQNEHHYFNAVNYFLNHNFDTFRFDFYGNDEKQRKLSSISFQEHTDDLNQVILNFSSSYKEVIVVGHSLGPLVILDAKLKDISKIVLWDPTVPIKNPASKGAIFHTKMNKYIFTRRLEILVSKELIEQWKNFNLENAVKELNTPCKIIFAGNCTKIQDWEKYLPLIKEKVETISIPGASHGFVEEGTEEKLFEETLKFLKK